MMNIKGPTFIMKIVHLSQTDAGAGAGRAAHRIHTSLSALGVHSQMIVASRRTEDSSVLTARNGILGAHYSRLSAYLEAKCSHLVTKSSGELFTPAIFGAYQPAGDPRVRDADIVCLYWINGGFLRPEAIAAISKPIVWRLSDVWPFTGGCHYPGTCERFMGHCGQCPKVRGTGPDDSSSRLWQRKSRAWSGLNLTVVCPSQWMATLARRSSLFGSRRIEVIHTGVDTDRFSPMTRAQARQRIGAPQDRLVLLFGAMSITADARKGFAHLVEAIAQLSLGPFKDRVHIVIFGSTSATEAIALPFPVTYLGRLHDDVSLRQAYSAADAVVVPSLEDNLPNVALEAIACGTPVVAFNIGGMPEIVRHLQSGYLAQAGDARDLARGIEWTLQSTTRTGKLGDTARSIALDEFSLTTQAKAYLRLFHELMPSSTSVA